MPSQLSSIDFIAYNREGQVVLLAEAKSRRGTSEQWAAGLRTNMLAHGVLPWAKYFLIATPDHLYLWRQNSPNPAEGLPEFAIDAGIVFAPYFQKLNQEPTNIGPGAFELIVLAWLTDLARSGEQEPKVSSAGLSELAGTLRQARIEMNPM